MPKCCHFNRLLKHKSPPNDCVITAGGTSLSQLIVTHSLHWRHNDHNGVSIHQPHGCLLNRLFRRRSEKKSKLRVTGLCVGKSPGPVNSPHKGPVTRKMFPFDDVIMEAMWSQTCWSTLAQVMVCRLLTHGHQFADDIFRCIFVNEKFCILIKISLKFVPDGPIDNSALV